MDFGKLRHIKTCISVLENSLSEGLELRAAFDDIEAFKFSCLKILPWLWEGPTSVYQCLVGVILTVILPVQEQRATQRTAAGGSVCMSSWDICRTEAVEKTVPINCEYIQTHTLDHQCFLIMSHRVEILRYKRCPQSWEGSPTRQPDPMKTNILLSFFIIPRIFSCFLYNLVMLKQEPLNVTMKCNNVLKVLQLLNVGFTLNKG